MVELQNRISGKLIFNLHFRVCTLKIKYYINNASIKWCAVLIYMSKNGKSFYSVQFLIKFY